MLTPTAIAAEIALNLDFLTTYLKSLPAREQGLRAVFASAWARLTSEEQQALRRLEVFRGDFTWEAAAAITQTPLPALAALVDKSLVRCVTPGTGGTVARYALVEPMRRYAAEQLACAGEATATAARHAAYYLARVEACRDELRGPNHGAALDAFEADLGQIRAAWQWAIDQADGTLLDSAAGRGTVSPVQDSRPVSRGRRARVGRATTTVKLRGALHYEVAPSSPSYRRSIS